MKRFFLIRHGLSLANTRNLSLNEPYIFDGDIPLTDKGIMQAKETALFLKDYCKNNKINLKDAIIWYSPFLRTTNTAQIINDELKIEKFYEDPRLSEMSFGLFDQRAKDDCQEIDAYIQEYLDNMNQSIRGKFYAQTPNGESPFAVFNRLSSFIDTVYRDNETNIFIVSHGITLRTFTMRLLHYNLEWYFNEKNAANCSVRLIEGNDGFLKDKEYIFIPK